MTELQGAPAPYTVKQGALAGLVGGLAAGVVNALVLVVAGAAGSPIAGSLQGPDSPVTEMAVFAPFLGSVVQCTLGGVVFGFLAKKSKTPLKTFRIVAVVFCLLSLLGPLTLPNGSPSSKGLLALMHVIAAVIVVAVLERSARRAGVAS